MKSKPKYWFQKHKLKHITGFVTPEQKDKLKALAELEDKSLSKYITRVIEKHIVDNLHKLGPRPS